MQLNILFLYGPGSPIDSRFLIRVEDQIRDAEGDHLYVVLESYGGDPLAAVQTIRFLQGRFAKIELIVPNFAMSAATLFALRCDAIFMQEKSVLGPLDLQIEHPKDGNQISVLDMQNIIFSFTGIAKNYQESQYTIIKNKRLSKSDAMKLAIDATSAFIKPFLEQIDPVYIQKALRETDLAYSYGKQLLGQRMMKGDPRQIHETLSALINSYNSHGYGISPEEAKNDLKLNVLPLKSLSDWMTILPGYNALLHSGETCVILFKQISSQVSDKIVKQKDDKATQQEETIPAKKPKKRTRTQ